MFSCFVLAGVFSLTPVFVMIPRKKKTCKECGQEDYIWSKGRCKRCAAKTYKKLGPSKDVKAKIDLDTKFYEEIWSERPHYCEECDKYLGEKWERYMFSHILSKGSQPRLRHNKDNVNLLCLEHHQTWEFGDKKSMNIYPENEKIIQMLREKILN
jgi:hypothetical protein